MDADEKRVNSGQGAVNTDCRCGPGRLGVGGLIGGDADGERGVGEVAVQRGLLLAFWRTRCASRVPFG